MANAFPFLLGAAVKAQPTRGTAASMETIGNGAAIDNTTDGAVLGDPDSGEGSTGISVTLGKNITEKAPITGSFTRGFANFIGRTVESLSMTIPLKGNGGTAASPPIDNDAFPDGGIDALLECGGLISAGWDSGFGIAYTPGATLLATMALYMGGEGGDQGYRVLLRDVEAKSITLDFSPGEVGKLSFDLAAVFDSLGTPAIWDATPFNYGKQLSLSAPIIENVTFAWLGREFGFSELSIVIDNATESHKAANLDQGTVLRQTDREIRISGIIDGTDADIDFEMTQLGEGSLGNSESLSFEIGTVMSNGSEVNAYRIEADAPELVSLKSVKLGNSQAYELEWICRAPILNAEFKLIYV